MIALDPTSLIAMIDNDDDEDCFRDTTVEEVLDDELEFGADEVPLSSSGSARTSPATIPRRRRVSGRYGSRQGPVLLELRVDVDGKRPRKMVSGDFFEISGDDCSYIGSFIVDAVMLTVTASTVRIRGSARFTFDATAPMVDITIARVSSRKPPGAAIVRFRTLGGAIGPTYTAHFESKFFRTFNVDKYRTSDTLPPFFDSYDTSALPSGGSSRILSLVSAYAEAGIEIIASDQVNQIPVDNAAAGAPWSDSELQALMADLTSGVQAAPGETALVVETVQHEDRWLGLLVGKVGGNRQGCAIFYDGVGGTSDAMQRLQLHTYVHELGHCFNVVHSWEKSTTDPPGVDRPQALSWMNYPWFYTPDSSAFWSRFAFQFDVGELVHLRHAFLNDILLDGAPFDHGAGLAPETMRPRVANDPNLILEVKGGSASFWFGEPVVLHLRLRSARVTEQLVFRNLHPKASLTTVLIEKPSGQIVFYQPLSAALSSNEKENFALTPIETSIYIGYGAAGHYFDQPGNYRVRVVYQAPAGAQIFSETATIRVRQPVTIEDHEVADRMLGDEQGQLLYLRGSDSTHLQRGREALQEILDRYAPHPMANHVRLTMGVNAARAFKSVDASGHIVARRRDLARAKSLLDLATGPESRVDELTKSEVRKWFEGILGKDG
jgi:hypothetical protein